MSRPLPLLATFVLGLSTAVEAEELSKQEAWRGAPIGVSHENGKWTLKGRKQTVLLNQTNLALTVQAGPTAWAMSPSPTPELVLKASGHRFPLRLADAKAIEIARYDTGYKTGIKITLTGWEPLRAAQSAPSDVTLPLPFTLYLTIALEGPDEDLVCDVAADERFAQVRSLDWPPAPASDSFEATVLSNSRGVLLPRDYPKPYHPIRSANPDGSIKTNDTSQTQSHVIEDWSMSWWGFQNRTSAMMLIIETPDDAAYQFDHPAGGPTIIGPRWRSSLDRLAYPRSARICFFHQGNYIDMAKRYRRYAIDNGLFVSLNEKIARKPVVKDLIGTPLMRAGILTNFKPDGNRSKKAAPEERYHLTTFDERAAFLGNIKSNGLERLTVVLTGWPRLGYDRQHPDVLPPAPTAGGWEGMQRLAEACRELGYLFSLHDQYRDYYVDAPSYDPQFAIHEEDEQPRPQIFPGTRFGDWKEGSIPFMDHWDGGKMTYLNGRFMLGHLIKNYQGLFDHAIRPQGNYLDVFGYVPPDEDFSPEHPTTRADCLRERARCYTWSRTHLGFVGTEAGCDWTIPYVDVLSPLNQTKGIPIPLFNLVYHDAVMMPYRLDDLRGFLNGGLPQIPARIPTADELVQIRRMCALHRRLALVEMTGHEFIGAGFRQERTTFADGTTVTVNWDEKSVRIHPELN
jgi:hypothetical protein